MPEPTTLGSWLRRERERRGITLFQISEQTKVSVSLLEGLEADSLSRWPTGIFRRSFLRSYATAIGLDGDLVVRRVEEEHPDPHGAMGADGASGADVSGADAAGSNGAAAPPAPLGPQAPLALQERLIALALDLLVAAAIAFGFAAGGSRLLWPVVAIASYHALGVLLAGTTPMFAIVASQRVKQPAGIPVASAAAQVPARRPEPQQSRRHRARRTPGRPEVRVDHG